MLRAKERMISEFPFVGFVCIPPIAEYNEAFFGHQDYDSVEKNHDIFVLQSDKKNIMTAGKTYFDTCKLINVKLYLNFEFYPYDDLNLDFGKAAILYVFTFLYVLLSNLS